MKRILAHTVGVLAAAAAVPMAFTAVANADKPGPVYFSAHGMNCSITDDGTVGCDLTSPTSFAFSTGTDSQIPVPFPVREVLIDVPWAPAHPGLDPGTPHTLPGGNPDIGTFGTTAGSGANQGPAVYHAGAVCAIGFHGSFSCQSKGHAFNDYEQITAS
ncbi:MAG: hypothetical protein J2P18_01945 [Nocardia sp.]|nr:hypothetical protein [Nocardia sp.]